MKIAVNTRWLLHKKLEGIGNFSHNLLSRLVKNHPEVSFDFYFDRPFHDSFIYANNVSGFRLMPPARHPYLWYVWYEYSLKRRLNQTKPDLFFSPDGFIPTNGKTKTLNTIHDLNFEHNPEWVPNTVANYYKKFFPLCAEKASHLITVSEFSKKDIVNTYGIDENKIDVVYNSTSSDFKKKSETKISDFKTKYTEGKPYFIFVGALNPRKNLQNIFPAFDRLESDHKFLIVGNKMHWDSTIENAYNKMQKKDAVVFSGRLSTEDLNTALSGATSMIFPSLFEGFGIPILEAFKSQTAVITANNSSLPEIAGDAALFVNAKSQDEILAGMQKIESNKELRKELIAKGKVQANKFDWDKSAEKLWDIMLKTIKG